MAAAAGTVVLVMLLTSLPSPSASHGPPLAPVASPSAAASGLADRQLSAATASLERAASIVDVVPQAANVTAGWHWVNSTPMPPGRASGALAYDPLLHAVVLFGGYLPSVTPIGDTWEFANDSWTNVTGSLGTAPAARWEAGFDFDPLIGALVLFGGRDDAQFFNDTWTFNATGWHLLTGPWQNNSAEHPPALGLVAMAFDPATGTIDLFGGGTGNVPAGSYSPWSVSNWTWQFNGSNATQPWRNIFGAAQFSPLTPPAVAGAGFAWDPYSGEMILLGGSTSPGGCGQNATEYALNGTVWTNLSTTSLPYGTEGFSNGGMVDDATLGGIVLYGGETEINGQCPSQGATWLYRNGTWTNLTPLLVGPAAPPSWWYQLAYDPDSAQALVYSDFSYGAYFYNPEEWILNGTLGFTAGAIASPAVGSAPLTVNFTGVTYGGVAPFNFTWTFATGLTTYGVENTSTTFGLAGHTYSNMFTVRDSTGAVASTTVQVSTYLPTSNGSLSAQILASPTQGAAPLAVNFTGLASGGVLPYSFAWDFGNGNTSASATATQGFGTPGTYVVTFTVTDATGTSAVASQVITVGSPGTAGNWSQVAVGAGPSDRSAAFMAYDPALSEVVLFGGYTGPAVSDIGDTWTYANGSWTLLNLTTAPAPRWEGGLVYDPGLSELVLFGGRNLTQFFNDTWAFTSTGWSRIATSVAPSPRGLFGMTYDPNADAIVLYGGGTGNLPAGTYNGWTLDNDTWEFTSAGWSRVPTAGPAPPALTSPGFAYDPWHNADLLYGGSTAPNGCGPIDQQWAFANGTWTNETNGTNGPGGSFGLLNMGFVEDPTGDGLLVFGGITTRGGGVCFSTSETWGEKNGTWTNLTGSVGSIVPVSRQAFPMTYDARDGVDLLFGGATFGTYNYLGDTWAFRASPFQLAPIHAHGTASSTSGTVPFGVTFEVTVGPGVVIAQTQWTLGDGASASGGTVFTHVYVTTGTFSPKVTVTTGDGRSVVVPLGSVQVTVVSPPTLPSTNPGPIGPVGAILGYSDLAGVAVGVLAAVALWAGLDHRRRRLREEGLDLVRGIEPPSGGPPAR